MSDKPQIVLSEILGYHNNTPEDIKQKKNAYKDQSTILIVPCLDKIPSKVVQNWMGMMSPMNQKFTRIFAMNMEVGKAYSETIEMIINHPELSKWKYIMTLEHDNMVQPDVLLRLLEDIEGYDAVGSLYYTKGVEGKPMCYTSDTEVLTESGWKLFKDVSFYDKVATLNEHHELEYHFPTDIQVFKYSGEMIHWNTQRVDLMVTPEHNVYCSLRHKDTHLPFALVKAQDVENRSRVRFKRDAIYEGEEVENVEIGDCVYKMDDWLEFLGYYLADGHCVKRNGEYRGSIVDIRKTEGEKYEIIANAINKLGLTANRNKGRIKFSDKNIYNYLKQLGGSYEKYVPSYIKSLSKRQIKIFIDALWMCDGHTKPNGKMENYSSVSRRLIDEIQELLLKIGMVGVIGKKTYFNKTKNENCTIYTISPSHSSYSPIMMKKPKRVKYDGVVYDLTVPNHTLYIRRNGKPLWSGNCFGPPMSFPVGFEPFQPAPNSVTQCNGLAMGATLFRMEMFKDKRFPKPFFETVQRRTPEGGYESFTQDLKFFLEAGKLGYKFAVSTRTLSGHYDVANDMVW